MPQIYFDKELYMFRSDLLSITRSLITVYTAIGIGHASSVDWSAWNKIHADLASRQSTELA
jgi:hypothetical protein